jgi:hypothetical protein
MKFAQNGVGLTKTAQERDRLPVRGMIGAGILAGSALGLLAFLTRGRRRSLATGWAQPEPRKQGLDSDGTPEAVRFSLLYVVPPIWLASSLSDWACHRYSRIEENAGVKESLIHLLMLGEMGVPVLATVFLEITSPVILVMFAGLLAHEVTVYRDLRIANAGRDVTPTEQMVHSAMEMMPLFGLWLVGLLRRGEVRALIGASASSPDFSIRLKEKPLPLVYRIALLSAIALFGGIPYLEELWRTARVAAQQK